VLALATLLYMMDLTVLHLASPAISAWPLTVTIRKRRAGTARSAVSSSRQRPVPIHRPDEPYRRPNPLSFTSGPVGASDLVTSR
jgi:hypothetical protein